MPRLMLFLMGLPCMAGSLQLNPNVLDPSQFRLTTYISGLPGPMSMIQFPDGSFGVSAYYPGIIRFTDNNADGIADFVLNGPGNKIYSSPGAHTALAQAGNYYIDGNFGDYQSGRFDQQVMTVLKPGATPADNLSVAGRLKLDFPAGWLHSQIGMATRPVPDQPGHYDLVFNVGAQYNDQVSTAPVQLSGLVTGTLDGSSLYAVTLDLTGETPSVGNLRKVASGIRNVIGMGFQPGTGDFYFTDNAIDGPPPLGDEPPQADELNRITLADFNSGAVPNFGYPTCYTAYRTGLIVDPGATGCVQPFYAIQPVPNGTSLGSESEGPAQMAFAPRNFPAAFANGIFIGFSGKGGTGPVNEENAVGFYDFSTSTYVHFVENSQQGVYNPIGIYSTANALYIADYGSGDVYQITAVVPEPGTTALSLVGIVLLAWWRGKCHTNNALSSSAASG